MNEYVLKIEGLSKKYGRVEAVKNLNLSIPKGSVFGILGPNGSGKTTTLGMVLGVINPTSGTYNWSGEKSPHKARRQLGAILEMPCFYHYLSAQRNLEVVAEIKMVNADRIPVVLDRVGLTSRKDDPFKSFSLGMKQRLAIASALLPDPEVMILDEPTNGLDPQGIAQIRDLIISLANEGRTIIIASHLLDEVQRICTDFVVLRTGEKIYQGRVEDLLKDKTNLELGSEDEVGLLDVLKTSSAISSFRKEGIFYTAVLTEGSTATDFHREIISKGVVLNYLNQNKNSLEKKFLEILSSEKNV